MIAVRLVQFACLMALSACAGALPGGDWIYRQHIDAVTKKPAISGHHLLLPTRYKNDPDYIAATCSEDGFEFFIGTIGDWGEPTRKSSQNQRFELRVGETVFKGLYLAVPGGDMAFLVSSASNYAAVNPKTLVDAFSGAKSVAIRIADVRGRTYTVSSSMSGNSEGLRRVAAECGII